MGESLFTEEIFALWEKQHLYRLYLCAAAIFLIYITLFIIKKNFLYISLAVANLIICALVIFFVPDITELLLSGDEGALEVALLAVIREAGSLLIMLNIFIFALFEFYNYKEK